MRTEEEIQERLDKVSAAILEKQLWCPLCRFELENAVCNVLEWVLEEEK